MSQPVGSAWHLEPIAETPRHNAREIGGADRVPGSAEPTPDAD